jgi:hypothetical protein
VDEQQPRVLDLTEAPMVSRERAAEEVRRLVQEARQSVALMEIAADLTSSKGSAKTNEELAAGISREARHANERLRRALSYLSALAVAAFVAVGLVVAPVGGGRAEAAEAPQPDPVAVRTVPVVCPGRRSRCRCAASSGAAGAAWTPGARRRTASATWGAAAATAPS